MIQEKRLQKLIDAYFDQTLTASEKEELEEMLLASSRARGMLKERAREHGLLREWALRKSGEQSQDFVVLKPGPLPKRTLWIASAMAAMLALAAIFVVTRSHRDRKDNASVPATVEDIALLAESMAAEWPAGGGIAPGSALGRESVSLTSGVVRIDFYSGARVYLQGPAELELISPELARLHHGKLTAHVPPPAEGFTVLGSEVRAVDRGTEFGMSVSEDGDCQVHVFDGEVELHPEKDGQGVRSLFGGGAVAIGRGTPRDLKADPTQFPNPGLLRAEAEQKRLEEWVSWQESSARRRSLPNLAIYYDFRSQAGESWLLENRATEARPDTEGTVIGCETVPGRWAEKRALAFTRISDRVRFRLEGEAPSVTMIASVRVDGLPHDHNALLSMAPSEIGEIHWKLDAEGRLLLGMRSDDRGIFESWERLVSPPVVTPRQFGKWMMLATVVDGPAREMRHYVDGVLVASAPILRPVPVKLGNANLGNFDAATTSPLGPPPTRTFAGLFDEFALFTRVLSQQEIAEFMPATGSR